MTNYEKLKSLPARDFWAKVDDLQNKVLHKYIDYPAYLDSEDPEIMHFVRNIGTCKLYPSQAECAKSGYSFEPERSEYREKHAKDMLVLEQRLMFSQPYFVVAAEDGNEDFLSVPASEIGDLKLHRGARYD